MSAANIVEVRWRAATAGTWAPLHTAPATNAGFTEAGEYLFETPGVGWSMRVDDELLERTEEGALWEPRFFAGEVTAELIDPDGAASRLFLLDVSPEPSKVGRDAYEGMIQELWAADPALVVGTEPGTRRIGELGASDNAWLAFARFRRYVPEFLRAAQLIHINPRRALAARRAAVPIRQVRRADRLTAMALARSAAAAGRLGGAAAVLVERVEDRFDVPVVEETLDCAANRAMLALGLALLRRGVGLRERLEPLVAKERASETRSPLATRWPTRRRALDELVSRLKALLRKTPFSDTSRPELSAAGLTAVAADPAYARAWSQGWKALRLGVELDSGTDRLWVSPSWEIYERWCFLRLGQRLSMAYPRWQWRRHSDRWSGALDSRRADLRLQPTFSARSEESRGMWSISKERVPDIVLTVKSANETSFLVFDAKYRTSRANVLDAMASAHIYQDSLRIGSRRPAASLLLVPSGGGAPALEVTAFHAAHRVGVSVLSPEHDDGLPELVRGLFEA